MAHSCVHCQKYALVGPRDDTELHRVDVLTVDHETVVEAASNGCDFFNWCLTHLDDYMHLGIETGLERRTLKLRAYLISGQREFEFLRQHIRICWETGTSSQVVTKNQRLCLTSLYIMAEAGDPAARYHKARPINKNVASVASFDLARAWLDDCGKKHTCCKSSHQGMMALRVIEIRWPDRNHDPGIRLVANTGGLLYAALSYCWGDSSCVQEIKLTQKNFRDWLVNIPFRRLPKSVQDGITTTWNLGLRHLWIDCLCILQDDQSEMAVEIAKMPDIYRGAHVTISAARSNSCDQGFLQDVQVPSIDARIFKFTYVCPDGKLGSILLVSEPVKQDRNPIDDRAWTLQEYILSPRLLLYGLEGLRFECREVLQYDDHESAEGSLSSTHTQDLALLRNTFGSPEMTRYTWSQLLSEYSIRALSNPDDRLLAISGIAKEYSKITNDKYLAGIWLSDLPSSLLWETTPHIFQRPRRYRAPSWSWAAIDGVVLNFNLEGSVDPNLSIISHEVQLVEPAALFGAVHSAHLTLKGMLKEALWDGKDLFSSERINSKYLALTRKDAVESESVDDNNASIKVWCLQVHIFDELQDRGPSGLILTRVHGMIFRRLGIFYFNESFISQGTKDATFYSQLSTEQREWGISSKMQDIVLV